VQTSTEGKPTVSDPAAAAGDPDARPVRREEAEGLWAWVVHRITGVAIFFFLFVHVLDTALVRVSPEAYNAVVETYKNPFMNVVGVGLVGAVLYHALNGLRVTAVDVWAAAARFERPMLRAVIALWLIVMVPTAWLMLERTIRGLFG